MRKLGQRVWMIAGAVVLVSSLGVGTVWSYLRTAHMELGKSLRDVVPIAFELKRLEQLTQELIPEIRANQKVAAQLDVESEYLEREVAALQKSQVESLAEMQRLRKDLDGLENDFKYGDKTYTRTEVESDLAHRMNRYDEVQDQLAAKEKLLESRRKTLAAATDKIRQHQQQRDLLLDKAAAIQAELKLAEAAQAQGGFCFQQSKLAQAKELTTEVEKKVRTLQKIVQADRDFGGEIPVSADSRPVTQRFDERFAGRRK